MFTTWDNLAPLYTTWVNWTTSETTWADIVSIAVTCPRIEVYNCETQ
jgi:hypothetical protein